jgi:hypothetical protein
MRFSGETIKIEANGLNFLRKVITGEKKLLLPINFPKMKGTPPCENLNFY